VVRFYENRMAEEYRIAMELYMYTKPGLTGRREENEISPPVKSIDSSWKVLKV